MNPASKEIVELVDTYNITRHAAQCYRVSVATKGSSWQTKYLEALDQHNATRHQLIACLRESGPVDIRGIVWSAEKLENGPSTDSQENSREQVIHEVKHLKDQLRQRYDDEKLKELYRAIDRL